MANAGSVRWRQVVPKLVVVVAIFAVTVPRLIRGVTDGSVAGTWIAACTGITAIGIIVVGVSLRRVTNQRVRAARDFLAESFPGGAFVVFNPEATSKALGVLNTDLVKSVWRGIPRGGIVTLDGDAFTFWESRRSGPVKVSSVLWSAVASVGVSRVAVNELSLESIVVRVRTGDTKVALFLPPESGTRGWFRPASTADFQVMRAAFEERVVVAPSV